MPTAGPKLLCTGKDAMERASKALRLAKPIRVGNTLLKPGTVFSFNKMLIYAEMATVYYTVDDRLYEYTTADFLRAEDLNAMAAGAKTAEIWIDVAKAENALFMGIFVPWYGMLGLTAAKLGVLFLANKKHFETAQRVAPKVLKLLQELRSRHPAVFNVLLKTTARNILLELPHGISAEDVAFFLGRVLQGASKLKGGAFEVWAEVSLGAIIKVAVKCAVLVTVTHAPGMAVHAAGHAAAQHAEKIRTDLAAQGLHLSREEAAVLAKNLKQQEVSQKLTELSKACEELIPVLNEIHRHMQTQN